MIQVDWLQYTFKCKTPNLSVSEQHGFKLINKEKRTANWNELYSLELLGKEIATICSKPLSEFIDQSLHMIKFSNDYLYIGSLHARVENCFLMNGWKIWNLSRLDLCYDFTHFNGGMHPREMIDAYLNQTIRKTDKCKFATNGLIEGRLAIDYVRWGTPSSDVSYYLYNKSRELKEKKHKPYIHEIWDKLGLDKYNTWRLEFRISSPTLQAVDLTTGETERICKMGTHVLEEKQREKIFYALVDKYFDFRYPVDQQDVSRLPRVELFKYKSHNYYVKAVSQKHGSDKMTKLFIKMLCETNDWLSKHYPDFYNHEKDMLKQLISLKIQVHGLEDWAKQKIFIPAECLGD